MKKLPPAQLDVLKILQDSGRIHAYEIKLRLKERLGHSSVYAALAGAEAKGYVKGEWEQTRDRPNENGPPRKYFELTAEGYEALAVSGSATTDPKPIPGVAS